MIGDESIRLIEAGRSGFRNATLIITWYRVAVVAGGRTRWIPLEEVQDVALSDKVTVHVAVGAESLRFTTSNGVPAEQLAGLIKREVAEARVPNSPRHHPDILQEWCERASERWNARIRLPLTR